MRENHTESSLHGSRAVCFINPGSRGDNHAVSFKTLNTPVVFKVPNAAGKLRWVEPLLSPKARARLLAR